MVMMGPALQRSSTGAAAAVALCGRQGGETVAGNAITSTTFVSGNATTLARLLK